MGKFEDILGLSDEKVLAQRQKFGSNELDPPETESIWDKLKENFEDPSSEFCWWPLV